MKGDSSSGVLKSDKPRPSDLFRIVANGTLLLPVLLALSVLGVALTAVREEKAALDKQTSEFMTQERDAVREERGALATELQEVRRLQADLLVRCETRAKVLEQDSGEVVSRTNSEGKSSHP
jgi:hypothetical protein